MNTNTSRTFFYLIVLFIGFISADLFAERIGVKLCKQEKSLWCWAASSEMIIEYYGGTITQSDIVKEIKGSVVNKTGSRAEMIKALKMGNVTGTSNNQLEEAMLQELAGNKEPFIIGFKWSSGGGHALVYDGYENNQYYINDPLKNSPTVLSYSAFKTAGGKGNWSMSITTKGSPTILTTLKSKGKALNNPSYIKTGTGEIQFQFNNNVQKDGILSIYSISGTLVHTKAFLSDQTSHVWNIHHDQGFSVTPGIYVAEFQYKPQKSKQNKQVLTLTLL